MMHDNDYYGGMHMGWWFFLVLIAIIIVGAMVWFRKRK